MRRVRLEKLCATKNCQADAQRPPDRGEALRSGRAASSPGLFGFGVLRRNFRGSIEHVVDPAGLMRPAKPGILPQAGTLCQCRRFMIAQHLTGLRLIIP